MLKEKLICISCKKDVANTVGTTSFNCPNCGKFEIIRCLHCRQIAAKYVCQLCQLEGPN